MEILEIVSRWHAGQSISWISTSLGYDRKTVRRYLRAAQRIGLTREDALPEDDELMELLTPLRPLVKREKPARDLFDPYAEEIRDLVTRKADPLKAKTAYEVIVERYGVEASYSSFKRFIRQLMPERFGRRSTCRMESDPGEEIQIDYGKMGLIFDPVVGRRRVVYAFCATLSHSRYKFIEYVYGQDQKSFVGSHVRMFEFFGGVPTRLLIDNLKSGVIKADRYDPVLNPLYREMAAHYGVFIDPARVRQATDKGKVERIVPLARELFRKLKTLNPNLDISEANRKALHWCRYENGEREHGTTGEKPAAAFFGREKAMLAPLPADPFEMATWKKVTVHPDQYIQFERKTYSVSERYIGHTLWARGTEKLLQLFDEDFRLVKQHVRTSRFRTTDWDDFPDDRYQMLKEDAPQHLLRKAERFGPKMKAYVLRLLEPHAKVNFRKAQGVLRLAEKHDKEEVEEAAECALSERLYRYRDFKHLLEEMIENEEETPIGISEDTALFVRPADYFVPPTQPS